MRYRFLIALLGLLASMPATAQVYPHPYRGTISATSSDCSTANSCVTVVLPDNTASATISVDTATGSFSGTLAFEQSVDGTVWIAVTPTANSTNTSSSTTSGGSWQINPSSYIHLRVRASARASGSAAIVINWGPAVASSGGGGGGPGSAGFDAITSGTNTAAAMVVGSGASLAATGTGTIDATTLGTHAASFFQTTLGYTPLNPANNLTDVANTATALSSIGGQAKLGSTSTTVSMGGSAGTKALVYVNTVAPLNLSKPYFDGTDWQTAPSAIAIRAQTAAAAAVIAGMDSGTPDLGKLVTCASSCTGFTITQAGVGTPVKFPSGYFVWVKNLLTTNAVLTATTSVFDNGLVTLNVAPGQTCMIESDGTNYHESCSQVVPTIVATTSTPITVAIASNGTMYYNQHATAATAIVYTLPATAVGKQACFTNSYNGSAANTGTLTITPAASSYIIKDGTLSTISKGWISGGAAGDSACVVGTDATHWTLFVGKGSFTAVP